MYMRSFRPSGLDDRLLCRHVDAVRAGKGVDERQIAHGGKVLLSGRTRNGEQDIGQFVAVLVDIKTSPPPPPPTNSQTKGEVMRGALSLTFMESSTTTFARML